MKKTKMSKKGNELSAITVWLPVDLVNQLEFECHERDETTTKMLKIILSERYLKEKTNNNPKVEL